MADEAARELPRIAFIFGDASLAEHVREAVGGHVQISYATSAGEFDAGNLAQAGVSAALVNLDGDDWLDEVEAQLDATGIPVVFNDPDISRQLDGWDRARWLRHLAAKLRGSMDFDPPRPPPPATARPAAEAGAKPDQGSADAAPGTDVAGPAPAATAADAPDPESKTTQSVGAGASADTGAAAPPRQAEATELPLSPREIETMTADFAPRSDLQTAPASSWNPVSAQITPQPASQPGDAATADAHDSPPADEPPQAAAPDAGASATEQPAEGQAEQAAPSPDALDVDTEALSAMIDARLAEPERATEPDVGETWAAGDAAREPSGHGPDTTAARDADRDQPPDTGKRTDATEVVAGDSDPDVLSELPSLDDWELIDVDAAPVAPRPAEASQAPDESSSADDLSGLTLVPMDPVGAVMKESDPIERWIDEGEGRSRAKAKRQDGDKA